MKIVYLDASVILSPYHRGDSYRTESSSILYHFCGCHICGKEFVEFVRKLFQCLRLEARRVSEHINRILDETKVMTADGKSQAFLAERLFAAIIYAESFMVLPERNSV